MPLVSSALGPLRFPAVPFGRPFEGELVCHNHARLRQGMLLHRAGRPTRFPALNLLVNDNRKNKNNRNNRQPARGKGGKKPGPKKNQARARFTPARVIVEADKRRRPARNAARKKANMRMTRCSLKWSVAIADPWSIGAVGACVPLGGRDTMKCVAWVRGTFTIGTAGTGFVVCMPTIANNCAVLNYSAAAFASNGLNILQAANTYQAGVFEHFLTQLPLNAAEYTNGIASERGSGRVVSAGLRVR